MWTPRQSTFRRSSLLMAYYCLSVALLVTTTSEALVPFIDGGNDMPALYSGWLNNQIGKQASSAVGKAIAAGKRKIEVQFPPVPNVDEVKFGTPLNKKFGASVVAKNLNLSEGGYIPGSNIARNQIPYANIYWAKQIASACKGGLMGMGGSSVSAVTTEQVKISQVRSKGDLSTISLLASMSRSNDNAPKEGNSIICINPGGEERWEQLRNQYTGGSDKTPFIVLNNAYSTTYDLGNQRGFEEAYILKRISKGWVFRTFPGPWKAYLERPDGSVELVQTYASKPSLKEVSEIVRDLSFQRYAINNDRWSKGFGERL